MRITRLQGGQQSESSNEGVCSSRQVWLAYCPSQDVDVAVKIVNLDEPSINLVRDFPQPRRITCRLCLRAQN